MPSLILSRSLIKAGGSRTITSKVFGSIVRKYFFTSSQIEVYFVFGKSLRIKFFSASSIALGETSTLVTCLAPAARA